MPAVAKTSDHAVVAAARALIERHGAAALSMQAVAAQVGVRAPSLYKRFSDRDALLRAVCEDALVELGAQLAAAAAGPPTAKAAARELAAMAHAYRHFARRSPRTYALLFAADAGEIPAVGAHPQAATPVLERLRLLVPARRLLPAARLLTAFIHGFVSMELAGAFQLGGSIDEAFDYGVEHILAAVR
jgi:AcrR family transcriptional regulator